MHKLLHLCRTCLISGEALAAVALVISYQVWPRPFWSLNKIAVELGTGKLLAPLSAILGLALLHAWKVLFPKENAKVLARFQKYPLLRITTMVALGYVVLGAALCVLSIGLRGQVQPGVAGLLLAIGYSIAAISLFGLVFAAMCIRSFLIGGK